MKIIKAVFVDTLLALVLVIIGGPPSGGFGF